MPEIFSPIGRSSQRRGVVVSQVVSREAWERCLANLDPPTFLQTWEWGEFNRRQGNAVFRLGISDAAAKPGPPEALDGVALVVGISARRARFLFCPHGPVLPADRVTEFLPPLAEFVKDLARQERASFIRFGSQLPDTPEAAAQFRRLGFRPAPIHLHPELAWILDLRPDASQLFAGMRKTMRQGIRRGMQLGVHVSSGRSEIDLAEFLALYRQTAKRQHFVAFPDRYVADELAAFGNQAEIFLARYRGEVLAGAAVVYSGRSGFYHHGASRAASQPVPAAYLLQWEIIQAVKRRGGQWYNFWGIAPSVRSRHPWAGLTAFKQGFGGFSQAYLPTQDRALSWRYWLNYAIEKARKIRRGF